MANKENFVSREQLLKTLGLPPNAEFLGYVIHNPVADDYLVSVQEGADRTNRVYAHSPQHAIRFQDFKDALAVMHSIRHVTKIGALFDLGDQYYVAVYD